jgi:hypothetical protein
MMEAVGYTWLIEHCNLHVPPPSHQSFVSTRSRIETTPGVDVALEFFQSGYHPGNAPMDHLAFALKYDDLNLHLLSQLFDCLPQQQILDYIHAQPNGKVARQIGFLYEFVTGCELPLAQAVGGNYVDLLDRSRHVVASAQKNSRWRINNNLLGTPQFCPLIRKTKAIEAGLQADFSTQLQTLHEQVSPDLFRRAIDYLYFKETRSSYDIEHEQTTPEREERFVAALRAAGRGDSAQALTEANLTALQNLIVEPRYAQPGFREWQNYVGEVPPGRAPIVHYICPPGEMVAGLMAGLAACAGKMTDVHPLVRATVLAFGFVFIHPFEDGNGRLHRYLIHDSLQRDGLVPPGMILPVSATMLRNMHEYDAALEAYSRPLKVLARYVLDDNEVMTLKNPGQVHGYYRFPDLTAQAAYIFKVVGQSINQELVAEIDFVRNYDQARNAIKNVVDMPDRKLDRLIKFMHQNKGMLSKAKRHFFAELSDDELGKITVAYREAFQVE